MPIRSHDLQTRTFDLGHQQLLVLEDPAGAQVDVLLGGVWLTEERQWQDRFAAAGQALGLASRGRTVLEAIGPSRVRVTAAAPGAFARWRQALRRPRLGTAMPRAVAALLAVVLGFGLPELIGRGAQGTQAAVQATPHTAMAAAPRPA